MAVDADDDDKTIYYIQSLVPKLSRRLYYMMPGVPPGIRAFE